MSEYTRQDVETMMNDSELMQIVNVSAELDSLIDKIAKELNTKSINVELSINSDNELNKLIDSDYHNERVELNKLNKQLDWLMVRYCAFNQVTRDELESILFYFKD